MFIATPSSPIKLGDVVELVPGYTPATVNLFDVFHVLEDDHVVDIWPVIPAWAGPRWPCCDKRVSDQRGVASSYRLVDHLTTG